MPGEDGPSYYVRGITFAGHDYLDAVRQVKIWRSTNDMAKKAGASPTVSLTKEIAVKVARDLLGGLV